DRYHAHEFDPADNAAPAYQNAFAEITESAKSFDFFRNNDNAEFPTPEKLNEFSEVLSENETALALLIEASRRPFVRLDLDFRLGDELVLSHINPLYGSGNILAADALVAAAAHDVARAEESLIALFQIAEHFTDEPFFVSFLNSEAISRYGRIALELILTKIDFPAETIVALENILKNLEERRSLNFALATALAYGNFSYEQINRRPDWLKDASMPPGILLFYELSGLKSQDKFGYFKKTSELIDFAELSPSERAKTQTPSYIFSTKLLDGEKLQALLIPSNLNDFLDRDLQSITYLRAARIGLAAERFRLATGQFPENLNELVPNYLEKLPIDPYNPDGSFSWIRENSLHAVRSQGTAKNSSQTIPIEFRLQIR
ncbi:MAG TPA: hypothetical protein VK041_05190, partial [Opitutales bacterium]|nr:hypothetical protein [Opitutales bacterium]